MQSEIADFAQVLPPGELDQTTLSDVLAKWTKHTSLLWFWPIRSITWKHDVNHKTWSTWHTALPSEEAEPQPRVTRAEKFGEICACDFWDTWAERQTDRQTRWLQYFASLLERSNEELKNRLTDRCCPLWIEQRWPVISSLLTSSISTWKQYSVFLTAVWNY